MADSASTRSISSCPQNSPNPSRQGIRVLGGTLLSAIVGAGGCIFDYAFKGFAPSCHCCTIGDRPAVNARLPDTSWHDSTN